MLEMLIKTIYYEVLWYQSLTVQRHNTRHLQSFKAISIIYEYHYDTEKRATQILAALISP